MSPEIETTDGELIDTKVKLPFLWIVSTPEPGPLTIMFDEIVGSAVLIAIAPESEVRSIVSEPELLPATHSPATAPEAVLVFAAAIASRKVHKPSLEFVTSDKLLTLMVA